MATGGLPTDLYGMLAADIGISYSVSMSTAAAHSVKLPPGRYLIQVLDISTNRVWMALRPWKTGRAADITAGVPYFPMDANGVRAMEVQVKPGFNDQVSAIMSGGTGLMIITLIERSHKQLKNALG